MERSKKRVNSKKAETTATPKSGGRREGILREIGGRITRAIARGQFGSLNIFPRWTKNLPLPRKPGIGVIGSNVIFTIKPLTYLVLTKKMASPGWRGSMLGCPLRIGPLKKGHGGITFTLPTSSTS